MTYLYERYCDDVEAGKIVTCKYVKQAVLRFRLMRSNEKYVFIAEKVHRIIDFFALLKHFEGKHNGQPFILQPWQQFICAAVYGFYFKDSGLRVVTNVYIEMARKNGKTAFAAGMCLYHLVADQEPGAEVYLAANSKDQAKISYKFVKGFSKSLDSKEQLLKSYRDNVTFAATHSLLKVLAADSNKLDGPNPSMFLLDEYHAARDTKLKDVLQSGQGMRENPMQVVTTTSGFDKLGPCYSLRTTCTEVLAGVKNDDRLYAVIYSLDLDDDWKNPDVWIKSNPNLDITVRKDYLESQVVEATNIPSEEVGIRTKNFNQWCDAAEVWIPDHYVLEATHHDKIEDYKGREAWGGIDLSSTGDLASVAYMIPDKEDIIFFVHYFLPESALKENRFRVLYNEWRRLGWLTITPGNVCDYDYILNYLRKIDDILHVQKIAYDPWNATQFVISATDAGLPMDPFSQTLGNFNRPTKEFERLILSGRVKIDDNGINRHCIRNVVMARDRNGNIKPTKQYVEKKIDGVITMLEALGVWLVSPRYDDFI